MSYVDALYDRDRDTVKVVGRKDGVRYFRDYPATYTMYVEDRNGKFRSIFGTPVSRFSTRSNKEFQKEIRINNGSRIFESDINPVFRVLEEQYKGQDAPKLHTAFIDIEVDFDQERGYSKPEDPFNAVTSVTVYFDWSDQLITLAIAPRTLTTASAQEIANEFENCFVFETEAEMLQSMLDLIDDADVLSGWNSEGFDIPYLVNRITRVLSKDDTRRFCMWDQFPKQRTFERYGTEHITFDLIGRVHMDYMQLYRKYTYEERHSYSLDSILEYEGLAGKTSYEGTLDQLYNHNFKKFIEYNRRDVTGLADLDRKLKFLDLANTLAHENTVLLPTTMGAVAVTEQAIINEAHERGLMVPNRKRGLSTEDTQAAGAYVAYPKKGIFEYIGAIDINSLYPSTIRAFNMGPETIVGQVRPTLTDEYIKERLAQGMSFARAWEGLFATLEYTHIMNRARDVQLIIDWEDGTVSEVSAAQVWKLIFDSNQPWSITANGTIFTYEKEAVIPGLLKRWYAERKQFQAELATVGELAAGIEIDNELASMLQ